MAVKIVRETLKDGSVRWRARGVSVVGRGPDGKRRQRTITCRTKEELEAELARLGVAAGGGGGEQFRHGLSGHPLYPVWYQMMRRCYNPESRAYRWYGGRGIKVCGRWHDVKFFIEDIEAEIGPKPPYGPPSPWSLIMNRRQPVYTLDRWPDNSGDYKPGNVRWATWLEQRHNQQRRAARFCNALKGTPP